MAANLMRDHIISCFIAMAEERAFHRITVIDIARAADINKNTFYYHFEDRNDLIRATYRIGFGEVLRERIPAERLVFNDRSDKYHEYPFYMDSRSEEFDLDLSGFFEAQTLFLKERMALYANLLSSNKPGNLATYLHQLYLPEIRKDLVYALGNFEIPEIDLTFLSIYFNSCWIGYTVNAAACRGTSYDIAPTTSTYNLVHTLMKLYCAKPNKAGLELL